MTLRGPVEAHLPRAVHALGVWEAPCLRLKAYGLTLDGDPVNEAACQEARAFVEQQLPASVAEMGEDNGLGFVIVHPGTVGLTVAAFWWAQGSVLCQRMHRRPWAEDRALDTAARPVIGCVYELALIDAEQRIWRETMMRAPPDAEAYLATRAALETV